MTIRFLANKQLKKGLNSNCSDSTALDKCGLSTVINFFNYNKSFLDGIYKLNK